MVEQLRVESCEQIRIRRKRLESNERRIAELKRLFIKIYEDNASERLTAERYDTRRSGLRERAGQYGVRRHLRLRRGGRRRLG